MPTTALSAPFLQSVQKLVRQKDDVFQARAQLVQMFVAFCLNYDSAYQDAKKLGSAAVRHLHDELGEDKSLLSKWRKVAEVARQHVFSKRVVAALPASQEAIVDLSRAELNRPGTIQRLVKGKTVTPNTLVRELRAALKTRKRRPDGETPIDANVPNQRQYVITLTCADQEELLKCVTALLKDSDKISASVMGSKPLYANGKAALGDWWKANETRFALIP